MKLLGRYLLNILKWLDTGVNVIFLFGASNETISERAAKARRRPRMGVRALQVPEPGQSGPLRQRTLIEDGEDAVIPDGK